MSTGSSLPAFPFELIRTDGDARAGVLSTPRGDVPTPSFMPVGTKGTVKAISPQRLREIGAKIVLANTYHLALRPGSDTVADLGGLHSFMGWPGPILTDSGGFQVFSLRSTARIDEAGVTFRSIYDGSLHTFTPEKAMREQQLLGADMVMCFDECPPAGAGVEVARDAVRRTTDWARRCRAAHLEAEGLGTDGPQMLFGIVQGGIDPRLRRLSAAGLVEIGFPAYAIGGLSVGEEREAMLETTALTASLLPVARPRYFMGIGDPVGLLEVIDRGIDMFDCVLPTRVARMGTAFTWRGRVNLRNAEHAHSREPLEPDCPCQACSTFTLGALRHFVMQKEILGLQLLTEHNLLFLFRLVEAARSAIVEGRYAAFKRGALECLAAGGRDAG
ncbi:MAG: tRNA guanosine(34) transglycosylase Tgt [Thermoleophilia bacterium]